MTLDQVNHIVEKELSNYGYNVFGRKSKSTKSIYFKLKGSSGKELLFRISDHKSKKNIITLRTDLRLTDKAIRMFVRNRVIDVGRRNLKSFFGVR